MIRSSNRSWPFIKKPLGCLRSLAWGSRMCFRSSVSSQILKGNVCGWAVCIFLGRGLQLSSNFQKCLWPKVKNFHSRHHHLSPETNPTDFSYPTTFFFFPSASPVAFSICLFYSWHSKDCFLSVSFFFALSSHWIPCFSEAWLRTENWNRVAVLTSIRACAGNWSHALILRLRPCVLKHLSLVRKLWWQLS